MALGDANNDLEMLRFAGYSVAMGNGNAAVEKSQSFITLTNDEDGVAHAIHKLIEIWKRENGSWNTKIYFGPFYYLWQG